jgi:PP-loop superfamily ATP-utilizing enzyme
VKRNRDQYNIPLKILSYDELYGWTMDAIVSQVGRKNNCTFCGVFRRQALDRGASMLGVDHIVTGHNADDIAETVLMNSSCAFQSYEDEGSKTLCVQSCVAILLVWDAARLFVQKEKTP